MRIFICGWGLSGVFKCSLEARGPDWQRGAAMAFVHAIMVIAAALWREERK